MVLLKSRVETFRMDSVQKIPVFVYPNAIKFYLTSRTTHKQLLTLYNPYDFPVRFKGKPVNYKSSVLYEIVLVLCTAPNKYSVIDPEGSIGPRSCVDIVIRHNAPISAHCNVIDKFRISMQDHTTKKVCILDLYECYSLSLIILS